MQEHTSALLTMFIDTNYLSSMHRTKITDEFLWRIFFFRFQNVIVKIICPNCIDRTISFVSHSQNCPLVRPMISNFITFLNAHAVFKGFNI